MADFKYKDYTPEESRIYDESMLKIREGMKNGLNFSEACSAINIQDPELRHFIEEDALKVMIAEMHYQKGIPLTQVADTLKVPLKKIDAANIEMLEDVGTTAAAIYRESNPDGPVGNA